MRIGKLSRGVREMRKCKVRGRYVERSRSGKCLEAGSEV